MWYDMQAQDLTAQGMEEAISESRNVIIFLSDNAMGRRFATPSSSGRSSTTAT